jgi:hypothetical protein
VALNWIRRTRLDGDGWDIAEVPLGEDGERYELAVLAGGSPVRTVATTQPSWMYSPADEIADFGVAQGEIEIVIAQISAVVGKGLEWRGRVVVR